MSRRRWKNESSWPGCLLIAGVLLVGYFLCNGLANLIYGGGASTPTPAWVAQVTSTPRPINNKILPTKNFLFSFPTKQKYPTYSPKSYATPQRTQERLNPIGPTALCNDGTLSYSEHSSGTCSKHGGVEVWYKK
jgi:hypothetical protein